MRILWADIFTQGGAKLKSRHRTFITTYTKINERQMQKMQAAKETYKKSVPVQLIRQEAGMNQRAVLDKMKAHEGIVLGDIHGKIIAIYVSDIPLRRKINAFIDKNIRDKRQENQGTRGEVIFLQNNGYYGEKALNQRLETIKSELEDFVSELIAALEAKEG
jgi:hypothetical protein